LITPKENILKQVRKNLVQPLPNPYPSVDLEKRVTRPTPLKADQWFAKNFAGNGRKLVVCSDKYEAVLKLNSLCLKQDWDKTGCFEKLIYEFLNDNGFETNLQPLSNQVIISGCLAVSAFHQAFYFSSETQNLNALAGNDKIILWVHAKQIEQDNESGIFAQQGIRHDLRVLLTFDQVSEGKEIYLFLILETGN
jgi:hypothetical protein